MNKLPWLSHEHLQFPPVEQALKEPNGLLAAGGKLTASTLLLAYKQGIFPWFGEQDPILWWAPDPRAVLFPDAIKVSKSLHKTLRKGNYSVTMDIDFEQVISKCAQTPRKEQLGTWLHAEMQSAYIDLHHQQHAHSVEIWSTDNQLIGGLYGVSLGQVFFGESMFSLADNASKIALVFLCKQLQNWNYQLIDCQIESSHLTSMGATMLARAEFKTYLEQYTKNNNPARWHLDWQYD